MSRLHRVVKDPVSGVRSFEDITPAGGLIAGGGLTFSRPSLMVPNKTSVTIPTGTTVQIGDKTYQATDPVTLSTASLGSIAGKDVYVYAVVNTGDTLNFVLSLNGSVPDGYTADNSRKIGGFHGECVAVGTISGHPLSGYNAGDILPASVWDLFHRPKASPEGMVYDEGLGLWVDIYLASWSGSKLQSVFGAQTADGTSTKPFHGELFAEEFGKIRKRLPMRDEFMCFAVGSNNNTNIAGSADAGTAGGHKDTANRRMISNIGVEDCCGFLWQWTRDMFEYVPGSAAANNQYGYYLNNYSPQTNWNYNSSVDGAANKGASWGFLRRARVGGSWVHSTSCGPRCVDCASASSHAHPAIGARGVSEPGSFLTA